MASVFHSFFIMCLLDIVTIKGLMHSDKYYEKFNILGDSEHTLTKYKGFGANCFTSDKLTIVKSGPLTEEEKQGFLKVHNDYRRKVARGEENLGPSALHSTVADMMELTWDEELARIAQRWAEQCPDDNKSHDENRQVDLWPLVGQNVIKDSNSALDYHEEPSILLDGKIKEVIHIWSQEGLHYNSKQASPFSSTKEMRNYIQLVWGNTRRLGCGVVIKKEENDYVIYIVCNYGPGGNMNGIRMYELGTPASKCPLGTIDNDGLCSVLCLSNEFLCDGNEDCENGEDEASCSPETIRTKRGLAAFENIQKHVRSEEIKKYNEECDDITVCKTKGAFCIRGKCQCNSTSAYHDKGYYDECLKIARDVNDKCVYDIQCTSFLGTQLSIECSKETGTCECKKGYTFEKRTNSCSQENKGEYNQVCTTRHGCRTINALCINGTCQCNKHSVYHSGLKDECLRIARRIGGSCEGDLQCTSSTVGDENSVECDYDGKCSCKAGFQYHRRLKQCWQKSRRIEYKERCSDRSTCRTTNAKCIDGRCQCEKDSVFDTGLNKCLKIASHLGDLCESDLQCTTSQFGNDKSIECASNQRCLCKKGFEYDPDNEQCSVEEQPVEYGDSCDRGKRCSTVDASCINGKCQCHVTHIYNKKKYYDECLKRATSIGDVCVSVHQCIGTGLGTEDTIECSRKIKKCLCKKRANYDSTKKRCIRRLSTVYQAKCNEESKCTTIGANCIDGRCLCPEKHVYIDEGTYDECLKIATDIGDPCLIDLQCTLSPAETSSSVECYKYTRKCICKDGFIYDRVKKQCKPEIQLIDYNGDCTKEGICVTTGATCINGRCKCKTSHVYYDAGYFDECLKIAERVGDVCVSDLQCISSGLGNASSIHCSRRFGKCLCTSGFSYHTDEGQCMQVPAHKNHEASCRKDSDCRTIDSTCKNKKCVCPDGSVYHDKGKYDECLIVAKNIGDPCQIHLQCSLSSFGAEGSSQCSPRKGICICKLGFSYNKEAFKCTKDKVHKAYSDSCKNTSECRTLNAVCTNGRCICDTSYIYYDNGFYDQCVQVATNINEPCVIHEQCVLSKLGTENSIECSETIGRCLCKSGFAVSNDGKKCVATAKRVAYKQPCNQENICITQDAKCIKNVCECEPLYVYNDLSYYDECLKIATAIGDTCAIHQQCTLSNFGNEGSIECTSRSRRCLCKEGYTFHISEQQCRKEKLHSKYRQACKIDTDCATVNATCDKGLCICKDTHVYRDAWFYDECLQIATQIGDRCEVDLQCTLSRFSTAETTECSKSRERCVCKEGNTYDVIREKCTPKENLQGYEDPCSKDSECITKEAKCLNSTCTCDVNYLYHFDGYLDECLKIAEKPEDHCIIQEQCTAKLGDKNAVQCYTPVEKCICSKGFFYSQSELRCKQDSSPRAYNQSCSRKSDCQTVNANCINNRCICVPEFVHNSVGYHDECLKIATVIGESCDINQQCTSSAFGEENSIHCSTSRKKCVCTDGYKFERSVQRCKARPVLIEYGKQCREYDICSTINAVCMNGRCSCSQAQVYHNFDYYDQCFQIVTQIGDKCRFDKQCWLSKIGNEMSIYCDNATHRCLCKKGYSFHMREGKCLTARLPQGYKQACAKDGECATINAKCIHGSCTCGPSHVYNDIKYFDECLKIATSIGDQCTIDLQCTMSTFGKVESVECSKRLRICLCKKGYYYSSEERVCMKEEALDIEMVNATLKQLNLDLNKVQKKLQQIDRNIAVDTSTNCPKGFTNLNGRCYAFVKTRLEWMWANMLCRKLGANLVSVDSEPENRLLAKYINEHPELDDFWSGGYDFFTEGVYIWESTHEPFEYTSWMYREPSKGREKQVVYMATSGRPRLQWFTIWYNKRKNSICEKNEAFEMSDMQEEVSAAGEVEIRMDDFERRLTETQRFLQKYSSSLPIDERTSCPERFVRIRKRCYYFDLTENHWTNINYLCSLWGAEMLSIETEEENNNLIEYMQANFVQGEHWTSGSNYHDPETFIWYNHKKEPFTFAPWKKGELPSGTNLCITFTVPEKSAKYSRWIARPCRSRYRIICERPVEIRDKVSFKEKISRSRKVDERLNNLRLRLDTFVLKVQIVSSDVEVDPVTNCPKAYFRMGKSCYYVSNFFYAWMYASQYCQDWGSHLVNIETAEENEAIRQHLQGLAVTKEVWIGGNDILQHGTYIWDGSNKNFEFTEWAEEHSHITSGNCVYIEDGKWKTLDCTFSTFFICEKETTV